jgi:hypothetical protein
MCLVFRKLCKWATIITIFGLLLSLGANCQKPANPEGVAVAGNELIARKVSPLLLNQIELRQSQIKQPANENLQKMRAMGMSTENIAIQKIFIYFGQKPTETQIREISTLGITVYPDSWIPPVGNSHAGFMLAEMPVDRLGNLVAKDYVINLDTAERASQPQSGPQGK